MPLESSVDHDSGVLIIVGSGELNGADIAAQTRSQVAHPPLPPPYHCLYDLRDATFVGELVELKDLARTISKADWPRGQRIAQVVGSCHEFGIARLFSTLAEDGPAECRVFEDLDEARRWLGIASKEVVVSVVDAS